MPLASALPRVPSSERNDDPIGSTRPKHASTISRFLFPGMCGGREGRPPAQKARLDNFSIPLPGPPLLSQFAAPAHHYNVHHGHRESPTDTLKLRHIWQASTSLAHCERSSLQCLNHAFYVCSHHTEVRASCAAFFAQGVRIELGKHCSSLPCQRLRQPPTDRRLAEYCWRVVLSDHIDQSRDVLRRGLHIRRQGRNEGTNDLKPVDICKVSEGVMGCNQ